MDDAFQPVLKKMHNLKGVIFSLDRRGVKSLQCRCSDRDVKRSINIFSLNVVCVF